MNTMLAFPFFLVGFRKDNMNPLAMLDSNEILFEDSVFEDVMFQVIGHSRDGYKISQTPVTSYEVADEMECTWVIGLPLSV